MPNTIITPEIIAKEAIMEVRNNLVMGNLVHTQYKNEFKKVGESVDIRKPVKMVAGTSEDITDDINDIQESTTSIVVDQFRSVPFAMSSVDMTLSIEEISARYIKPAAIELAQHIDTSLCGLYKQIFQGAGAAGTPPTSFSALGGVAIKLGNAAVPNDDRSLVLNPAANWGLADGLKGLFLEKEVRGFVTKGALGHKATMDIHEDQSIFNHTKGVATGTPLIAKGSDMSGGSGSATYVTASDTALTSTLYTDGWTNDTTDILLEGDVFTIAAVYGVNPRTRRSTGALQQFVVRADVASGSSSGPAALTVSPAIVDSGAYQTVVAAPVDEAVITVVASHAANLAFHKNALALVTVPLVLPDSCGFKARISEGGISIAVTKGFDIKKRTEITRLDVLYGVKAIYPEMAARLFG